MSRLIKLLSIIVVLLIAAVIGGVAVLKSKDFNEYKGLIAEKVKEATGRDLAIAGNLDLRISLSPALAVEGVSFSNASWGTRPQMMTLKSLEAQVSLLPLLMGTVSIDRVVLNGLDVLAETDAQGRGNWEFGKRDGGKAAARRDDGGGQGGQIPEVKLVQIRDVAVTYKDGKTGAVMKARLDHLEIEDDGGKGLRLDVAGALDHLAYKVAGRITEIGETLTLDGLKATVAGSDLAGRMSVRLAAPVAVTADLTSSLVDVDGFKPKDAGAKAPKAPEKAEGDAKENDRVFSDDPLPVDGLKAVNADITFKAATVKASGLTITDVHAQVALKGGKLAVKPAGAKLAGGDITAALVLDAGNKVPALAVVVTGDKIDYGGLLKQFQLTDMITGTLSLAIDAKGKGMSVRTLMAGLDGDVKVTGKGGRLDLGAMSILSTGLSTGVGGLTDILKGKNGNGAKAEDAQTLRCIYLDFPIRKGISLAKAAVVETGGFAMIGEGGANLRDETLALRFQPRAKEASLATLVQPVTVGGTFANPSFGVEAEKALTGAAAGAAAAAVATGGLSVIVGGLIGAGSAQGTDETDYCALAFAGKPLKPAQAPASSPSPSSPTESGDKKAGGGVVEGIGGALKGLFGK